MPFHFSLESVLKLRRTLERMERLKLEAIISEQARVQARLQEVTDTSFNLHRQFLQRLDSVMAGSELELEAVREANVNSLCRDLRIRLLENEERRAKQVQVFVQVRRNREVLENLRLRKFHLYRTEQGRREQQGFDDLFLMRKGNEE